MKREPRIYFILDRISYAVKIGYAADVLTRMSELQTGNPNPLELIAVLSARWSRYPVKAQEEILHNKFHHDLIRGEWFRYSEDIKQFLRDQQDNNRVIS